MCKGRYIFNERGWIYMIQSKCSRITSENIDNGEEAKHSRDNNRSLQSQSSKSV